MKAVRGLDLKFETLTGGTYGEWSRRRTRSRRAHADARAALRRLRAAAPRPRRPTSCTRSRRSTASGCGNSPNSSRSKTRCALRRTGRSTLAPEERVRARRSRSGYCAQAIESATRRGIDGRAGVRRAPTPQFRMVDTAAAEFPAQLAVLLSLARRSRRDAPAAARGGRRRRQRTDPHRPRDRVRLLVRARGVGAARGRPLAGRHQQQSRDGLDRFRHLRRARLRAARRRRSRSRRIARRTRAA